MKFVQDTIERKLSQLLARQVTFERLNVSPLSGQVEAEGMTVAGDDSNPPLLSVKRISAKIAIAKALAGQIVIKSMEIEGPSLRLPRLPDGSIQFPCLPKRPADEQENKADAWQLEAQSIRLTAGAVFLGPLGGGAVAEKFTGELKMPAGSPATAELKGSVDIARCLGALSPAISLPPALSTIKFDGPADIQILLEIDYPQKIHIREVTLRAGGIQIPLNLR
jgi:hypothetical protein